MMEVIKPPALKTGDKLAIVSPAGPPVPEKLEQGVRLLKSLGYRIIVGDHIQDQCGYLAGSDESRITDFNKAVRDPDIRGIICSRGGYGSSRILSRIDYESLKNDPKVIVGFSDITALLSAIYSQTGLITFHGPMIGGIATSKWSFDNLFNQLKGSIDIPWEWINPPDAKPIESLGRLISTSEYPVFGGCLSILSTLAGTPWLPPLTDHLLFIEDVGEAPYRIDRLCTHLINSCWFQEVKGILLGNFVNCSQRSSDTEPTPSVEDVLKERFGSMGIPVVSNLAAGHADFNGTIPIGVKFRIEKTRIYQMEKGVL